MSGHIERAEQAVAALADRRQRAREAFYDGMPARRTESVPAALAEAIEVATRVKITRDIVEAAELADDDGAAYVNVIAAAFAAAGFEVVE